MHPVGLSDLIWAAEVAVLEALVVVLVELLIFPLVVAVVAEVFQTLHPGLEVVVDSEETLVEL